MPLLNGSIPSLTNGISQQPYPVRLPSQAELQENAYSSIADGLVKRPPTQHVAQLLATLPSNAFVHFINRDESEQYVVVVYAGSLKVFKLSTGAACPVYGSSGSSAPSLTYLNASTPSKDYRMLTLADTTFVVNRQQTVAMNAATTTAAKVKAAVKVVSGQPSTKYTISIDGSTYLFTHTTGTGAAAVETQAIASALQTGLNALPNFTTNFECIRSGSNGNTLYIRRLNDAAFEIAAPDSMGDTLMKCVTTTVQRFSDLPATWDNGTVAKVSADAATDADDYWVKLTGSIHTPGTWAECPAPGSQYQINNATMPHTLVRYQDDGAGTITGTPNAIYFRFVPATWGERLVGSTTTNPNPSYVGKKINDLFLFRNRLGFLSDTNVVLSAAADFFRFFRSTSLTLRDDDPIDVSSSHPRVAVLRHAVPFNQELIIFSDTVQFVLTADDVLSPFTVKMVAATEFQCDPHAAPAAVENLIYFAYPNGSHAGVREFFVDANGQKDATTITAHVPKYLTGAATRITVSPTEDVMILSTDGEADSLFVYKWFWNGSDKLQSSWSEWEFAAGAETTTVFGTTFIGPTLYLVVGRGTKTYLEKIDLSANPTDEGVEYLTHLDRRVLDTGATFTYDAATDRTTVNMPYDCTEGTVQAVVQTTTGSLKAGQSITVTDQLSASIKLKGDLRNVPLWLGRQYTMRYRFSPAVLREQTPVGGMVGVTNGRLQVRTWSVAYSKTGYFRVEVTPLYRDTLTEEFTGRVVGSSNNVVGQVPLESGVFKFMVFSKNDQVTIDLVNDSPLPCRFVSAEWEAVYNAKARRV